MTETEDLRRVAREARQLAERMSAPPAREEVLRSAERLEQMADSLDPKIVLFEPVTLRAAG